VDLDLSGKVAVVTGAEALSEEPGPKGIRINSVSPGPVSTDLWLGDDGVDPDAVQRQAPASAATGRFTTPEEVATLVAFLASPRSANVTGANYVIDGGLVKTV
jgi:NAD(P)-dependent dehydrogenase (short-subunit alcohol dehydrogenase family)